MRTTSSVEAMNSVIQRQFPTNPHIFKFIENLKLHESIKSTDLYQLGQGTSPNEKMQRKRAEDRVRDDKIKFWSEKLKNGEITVAVFLKSMATESGSQSSGVYFI